MQCSEYMQCSDICNTVIYAMFPSTLLFVQLSPNIHQALDSALGGDLNSLAHPCVLYSGNFIQSEMDGGWMNALSPPTKHQNTQKHESKCRLRL